MNRIAIAAVTACIAIWAAFFFGADYGRSKAEAKQSARQAAIAGAWRTALVAEVYKRHDARLTDERKAREATAKHDQALSDLDHAYERDLAALRRTGGLRIPRPACAGPAATGSEAAGASGSDEGSAATVELPEGTQERLFNLTLRADRLAEQLRGLQGWVMSNGFYGTADENPGNP